MKKFVLGSAILASATVAALAVPIPSITSDELQVTILANTSVRWDDNISLTNINQISDTIFEFDPGLSLDFGRAGAPWLVNFTGTEDLTRYDRNADLDSTLAHLALTANYTDLVTTGGLNAGYAQIDQNLPNADPANPSILDRHDTTDLGGKVETDLTGLVRIGLAVQYEKITYDVNTAVGSQVTTVPLNFFYKVDPVFDVSAGAQLAKTDLENGVPGYTDYYYNIGARLEPNQLWSGSYNIGLDQRSFQQEGVSTTDQLGMNGTLTYTPDSMQSYNVGVGNNFGQSQDGQSQRILNFNAGLTHKVGDDITLIANAAYNRIDFEITPPRQDKFFSSTLAIDWVAIHGDQKGHDLLVLEGAYIYTGNASTAGGDNAFRDNTFKISAIIKY
jgi:hypothetical protein